MIRLLTVFFVLSAVALASDDTPKRAYDFTTIDGFRAVRSVTPGEGYAPMTANNGNRPIRNPRLLSRVVWVDRAHENAVAENVTITPDGSGIFAGWWLNNERFAAYTSAGLEAPLWRYNVETPWTMPVAATDQDYTGTGSGLPSYIWDKSSPLFTDQINFEPGYAGGGMSYSGDGSLLAVVSANGTNDGILAIYNTATMDTVLTRHFVPVQGLYGVDMSVDGSMVVVSCYGALYVYEVPSGNFRGELYNYSQGIAKISGNGSRIVTGTYGALVILYQWDGSTYVYHWNRNVLHDWVTAVDISDDGSTVVCGTMDFVGGQIGGGRFIMWDAESGNELINYTEYGDMVASVALSANGRFAIAGSYGKYGETYGDVATGFMRGSTVPIFQLWDDLDETGSVFAVAISDSGHFAAAGGKAVHAREFGNGGMLYSIQLRDPLAVDAAVASIDSPGEFLAPSETVIPTATFINVGTAEASFAVACTVVNLANGQVVYSASSYIVALQSFVTEQVSFSPSFTMPSDGRFKMTFSSALAGDQDPANDDLALTIRSWHDVRGLSASSPFDEVTVGWATTPTATFKNMGSFTESIDVEVSIRDSLGVELFNAISTIFGLAPYGEEEVQFTAWVPDRTGLYTAVFNAPLLDDRFPSDNILTRQFRVVDEMLYDDGSPEVAIWVDAYPYSANRMFAQRFDPNIQLPFSITSIRFFVANVAYAGIFDYIGIAAEDAGLPDTNNVFIKLNSPELPSPGNWASYDINLNLTYQPLWVILHWPDSPESGPYIGADNNPPIDMQSYWFSEAAGWNQYRFSDWMIRMTLREGSQGVENDYYSGLPRSISLGQNYPNPFNPTTNIEFALPNDGHVKIEIFNSLGQRVRRLSEAHYDAGYHSIIWDSRTDTGDELSSGVYYYRLTTGDHRISRRMTLLK